MHQPKTQWSSWCSSCSVRAINLYFYHQSWRTSDRIYTRTNLSPRILVRCRDTYLGMIHFLCSSISFSSWTLFTHSFLVFFLFTLLLLFLSSSIFSFLPSFLYFFSFLPPFLFFSFFHLLFPLISTLSLIMSFLSLELQQWLTTWLTTWLIVFEHLQTCSWYKSPPINDRK